MPASVTLVLLSRSRCNLCTNNDRI